jgi:hypothetical protein
VVRLQQLSTAHLLAMLEGDEPIPPLSRLSLYEKRQSIDATTSHLVVKLAPTLTELDALLDFPDVEPFLAQMISVRSLTFRANAEQHSHVQIVSLVAGVRARPQLTTLSVDHPLLTNEYLCSILGKLNNLNYPSVGFGVALETLSFLSAAPRIAASIADPARQQGYRYPAHRGSSPGEAASGGDHRTDAGVQPRGRSAVTRTYDAGKWHSTLRYGRD